VSTREHKPEWHYEQKSWNYRGFKFEVRKYYLGYEDSSNSGGFYFAAYVYVSDFQAKNRSDWRKMREEFATPYWAKGFSDVKWKQADHVVFGRDWNHLWNAEQNHYGDWDECYYDCRAVVDGMVESGEFRAMDRRTGAVVDASELDEFGYLPVATAHSEAATAGKDGGA
jgi:hypothetical protein